MTDFTYTVIKRPKKFETGRTDISWATECGREAVTLGGYLVTARAPKGTTRQYTAFMVQDSVETEIGTTFETRAQAAFAIWRKYYEGWRSDRTVKRGEAEAELQAKRDARAKRRSERQTPEGQKTYREELNQKARERRAAMTAEERVMEASKRRAKRERKREEDTLHARAT